MVHWSTSSDYTRAEELQYQIRVKELMIVKLQDELQALKYELQDLINEAEDNNSQYGPRIEFTKRGKT